MRVVDKAFAYITSRDRLLVFEHVEMPEAGVQVPAGTVLAGESPAAAVVREAREETGLDGFSEVVPLGVVEFDARPFGRDEIHRRHFFHLPLPGWAPERWRHHERDPSEGAREPIEFELYWVPVAEAAAHLLDGHGCMLEVLRLRCPTGERLQALFSQEGMEIQPGEEEHFAHPEVPDGQDADRTALTGLKARFQQGQAQSGRGVPPDAPTPPRRPEGGR